MAMKLGATRGVDVTKEKICDVMKELDMKEGFDVGLEMSGSPAAMADLVNNMANGGNIAILGIFADDIKLDWDKVIFRSLTMRGIYGREMFDTWYKMSALLKTGLAERLEGIVTHNFHYTDFKKGFDTILAGEAIKVVLDWE